MSEKKSDMSVESDKKKRNIITLDTKHDIAIRFGNRQSKGSMSWPLGLSESTVRLILFKSDEYIEIGKVIAKEGYICSNGG
jgi:hypothetical protein